MNNGFNPFLLLSTLVKVQHCGCAYSDGFTPTMSRTWRAILLCRFQCSTAMATSSPPTNSMLESFRYWVQTFEQTEQDLHFKEEIKRDASVHLKKKNWRHLCGFQDAHHGEENDRQQGGDSQRDALCAPVERHENDGVAAFCLLQWWKKCIDLPKILHNDWDIERTIITQLCLSAVHKHNCHSKLLSHLSH